MKLKQIMKQFIAVTTGVVLTTTAVLSPFAADTLSSTYTYSGGGLTFEKISHPDTPVESADGIVDYIGNGSIAPYICGESETGRGDRGQSYSYASLSYGDWVYINTMYGGLGVSSILNIGMGGDAELSKAIMDTMYNGHLYTGEPDDNYAGGVLLKYNVKTGETKILMSRNTNGLIPTFRNAVKMNGKLYFVGMVIDMKSGLSPQEINQAIAIQSGFPCIYEIDPENNDKMTCIYNCVNVEEYKKLVADNVFTSTRAIGTYKDALIAGCLDTNGVFISASKDPSAGKDSFQIIADMNDLFHYPAYHRSDANGGGGIYQVIEYNEALYVVVCTGTAESKNEDTGTLRTFAIIKGKCNGEITDKSAWSWSVLAGDPKDGAKYPFGLDEERVSAVACTLQEYDGYLYIGDYNDVSSALQGFVLRKDFITQATNLQQSINLYRMDENENIEKVVGDPTVRFPESSSGLGSGYSDSDGNTNFGTHMNQYTWQTTVYNGKMYVGTMDTTTLLEPIAQFTNGDLLNMSSEEWESQIMYLRTLLELLFEENDTTAYALTEKIDEDSAAEMVEEAIWAAEERENRTSSRISAFGLDPNDEKSITLTEEQKNTLIAGLLDGSIVKGEISEDIMNKLTEINNIMSSISDLIDTTDIEIFSKYYNLVLEMFTHISDLLPKNVQKLYDILLSVATKKNLVALAKSVQYMAVSETGFDLFEIENHEDGSVTINPISTNGFGDRFNHGLRIFEKTDDYWLIGTANPFYGTQLWRTENLEPAEEKQPSVQYRTHVQNIGWQPYVADGVMSGTKGKGLRLEGINIRLDNNTIGGSIEYRTHVQNIGWQPYVSDGAMAGTSGKGLRLEAIQVRLAGAISEKYDVYYRTHVQDLGWLGWAANDGKSGTAGLSKRLEGVEIRLVEKGQAAPGSTDNAYVTNKKEPKPSVSYTTHVQNIGWQEEVMDGAMSGTRGKSLRLEGIKIHVNGDGLKGGVEYTTHVQNIGWQPYVSNGEMAGTKGKSLRLEGIKIRLTGELAQKYSIEYRTHVQNEGWQKWVRDDAVSGTTGKSLRLEGIEIRLIKK
ncbi:MAG: hypothetical protein MSG78_00925 [Clostridiales bacterium]|nr:hypothetical protein [Clostridiales bacterium]